MAASRSPSSDTCSSRRPGQHLGGGAEVAGRRLGRQLLVQRDELASRGPPARRDARPRPGPGTIPARWRAHAAMSPATAAGSPRRVSCRPAMRPRSSVAPRPSRASSCASSTPTSFAQSPLPSYSGSRMVAVRWRCSRQRQDRLQQLAGAGVLGAGRDHLFQQIQGARGLPQPLVGQLGPAQGQEDGVVLGHQPQLAFQQRVRAPSSARWRRSASPASGRP